MVVTHLDYRASGDVIEEVSECRLIYRAHEFPTLLQIERRVDKDVFLQP